MRLAIWVVALLLGVCCCSADKIAPPQASAPNNPPSNNQPPRPDISTQVTCPVCGLDFQATEAAGTYQYQGTTYYFLVEDHMAAFVQRPNAYLAPEPE
ncbi:MAG: hypothetical protein QNJ97_27360 [Myxococcota bacterium]|nr:hypothetical protein [Myxococcota bacterium]